MPTKMETTPSSAKTTTAKKEESKKSVIERKTPGASAARETKAVKKDTARKPTPAPGAKATVSAEGARPVRIDKAAAEKPAAALTQITAYVDIGPGNTLFLRGEGGGLSWEAGVAMECIGGDCWSWSARSVGQDITFKLLINDQHWSTGDNLTVADRDTATFMPAF
jgi:hypothetical protein